MSKVEGLFTELDKALSSSDFDSGLSFCEKILVQVPGDKDALHCKAVCLIQTGKIPQALSFLKEKQVTSNKELNLNYEKAYCHYRNKENKESLNVLKTINPKTAREVHLLAQVNYRLEDWKNCVTFDRQLIDEFGVESPEIKTNLMAAYVSANQIEEGLQLINQNKDLLEEHFEFTYNVACVFIQQRQFDLAEKYLLDAKRICEETLAEDGLSEKEIQDELAVILTQLAYVQQQTNIQSNLLTSSDEPTPASLEPFFEQYNQILKSKPSDASVVAVATNNLVGLRKQHDLFDSLKRIKAVISTNQDAKLSLSQRLTLHSNHCLVLYHINKLDQCTAQIKELESTFPGSGVSQLLTAAILHKENKTGEAISCLESFLKSNSKDKSNHLKIGLSLAQLYLIQKDRAGAIRVLQPFLKSTGYKMGLLATLVYLYEQQNDYSKGMDLLQEAANYWSNQKTEAGAKKHQHLMKEIGNFQLKHGRYQDAAKTFELLYYKSDAKTARKTKTKRERTYKTRSKNQNNNQKNNQNNKQRNKQNKNLKNNPRNNPRNNPKNKQRNNPKNKQRNNPKNKQNNNQSNKQKRNKEIDDLKFLPRALIFLN
eukprot:TRINITY_DN1152_c0_g1_i3.p1 TRINITY_DN1152_c0_g1~~TRINITY_DN1152_c0_g1_i3.p1  ORF type:complete len:597 (+),score=152.82 TRINITY_DN1152_c0_g1_i3:67-1857(+)